jgi:regulator of sirC expression with transglutaminase-like and TPR domain
MRRWGLAFFLIVFVSVAPAVAAGAENQTASDPAAFVRALLNAADETSFAELQLAIDKAVDPAVDIEAARIELDAMVATVNRMLATIPPEAASTSIERMRALRTFIYESGWWNDHRPFGYDLDDPRGQNLQNKVLAHYMASRRGNCVSMPTLFLVLGERLGLDVTLSTAPLHVFVKWTDDANRQTYNLETTSGAGGTRDSYYRERMPMTDEAIANGVYMKTLTRKEAVSAMATTLLEHLLATKRYEAAIAVSDVLLEAYPAYAYVMVKKGTAYYRMLDAIIVRKHGNIAELPTELMPYAAHYLNRANKEAFDKAEALGWREPILQEAQISVGGFDATRD